MCGRYAIAPTRTDAWASVASELGITLAAELGQLKPRYNIPPSLEIPIIVYDREARDYRAISARWGFVPHWWKQAKLPAMTNNARVEGAADKPMWRDAWKRSRCLIPATHWYEWQERAQEKMVTHTNFDLDRGVASGTAENGVRHHFSRKIKQPWAHTSPDGRGFMFAGLWSSWKGPDTVRPIVTAAIITRDASPAVAHVHDRMPVILHPVAWTRWLSPDVTDPQNIAEILEVNAVLEAKTWPVTRQMSKPVFSGPECLDPIDDAGE